MDAYRKTGSALKTTGLSRRQLLQICGLAVGAPLVAGGLSACSSGDTSTASASGGGGVGGDLTFAFLGNANQQAAVKAEYAGFVTKNPSVNLIAQGIAATNWAGFANTVATRIAGGSAPDVIDIATEGLNIFRSKQLVTDLGTYIKKDQSSIDDYYADMDPGYKKLTAEHGNDAKTTFFMPGGFNTVCLYCNTEVFKNAGVDLPGTEDWTWDDFEAAAKKIKDKTGAFILPFTQAQFTDVLPWLLSNGASTLDPTWTKPVIDSPAAVEAAEFCKMMVDKGYSPKPGGTFDAPTLLSQGKLAALAGGRWPTLDMVRLKIVDKVQIVKTPKKTTNGTPIGWDTFPILNSSKNMDTAWAFIKYLTTKEAGEGFAKNGSTNIPARKSIALSSAFLDGAPKGTELLYQAAAYATPVPSPARGAESQTAVEQMWLKILTGGVAAEAGLKQLSDQLAALL